ncbi:MAG TPA: ORF6N domain-containing protein [Pedobacter sp.]|uniref:ORF6N domain-containing protein n=1 Tax=Pedobacter sp. TaxID=1411316 RepID=UPI002B9D38AF|nr:ORF6N domain-containing protein [Pedobacter sp.]
MTEIQKAFESEAIQSKIYIFRDKQVMIDRDLAELFGLETRSLNQAVKRNIKRFPQEFMFRLDDVEFKNWVSQSVIPNNEKMGLRILPYVFTEQGIAMLSTALRSDTAITVSIQIMNAFVEMRRFLRENSEVLIRLDNVEQKHIILQYETNKKFDQDC